MNLLNSTHRSFKLSNSLTRLFLLTATLFYQSVFAQEKIEWIANPSEYEYINISKTGYHAVKKNGKWGYIDNEGKSVLAFTYQDAFGFNNQGVAAVKQNDKWGLIDKEGNFVLKPKYESFVNYREGLDVIYMTQKNKSVYIDSKGNELFKDLKSNYSLQYYEENGLAVFNKDPYDQVHNGVIKAPNQIIIPPKFRWLEFKHGFIVAAKDDNHYAIYDNDGKVIVPYSEQYLFAINKDLIAKSSRAKKINGKYQFLNGKGKSISASIYDSISYNLQDGLIVVSHKDKYGALDQDLKKVIPYEFEWINDFRDGIAVARKKDKIGLIDKRGKWLIPPKYDELSDFVSGFAIAKLKDKHFIINLKGEKISSDYTYMHNRIEEGFFVAYKENKNYALLNSQGKEVTKPIYENFSTLKVEGLFFLVKKNKWGAVDKTGKEVIPFIFDTTICSGEIDYLCEMPVGYQNRILVKYKGKWGIFKY